MIREILSESFLLVSDFLQRELKLPAQETLGADCWNSLLNVNQVYEAEERDCRESLGAVDWKYASVERALQHLRCEECRSSLVRAQSPTDTYPEINLHCKSCDSEFMFSQVAARCVVASLEGLNYLKMKDGGFDLYERCPQCNDLSFIHAEDTCIICEYKLEHTECMLCSHPLGIDQQILDGFCESCSYRRDKHMRD